MSTTTSLNTFFNSQPASSSPLSGNLVAMDYSGNLSKTAPQRLVWTNLDGLEPAGSTITLEEFALKYLNDKFAGHMLTANQAYQAAQWFVKINDSLTIGTQRYIFLVTKKVNSLASTWAYCTVFLIPAYKDPTDILLLHISTGSNAVLAYDVFKIPMTQLGGG